MNDDAVGKKEQSTDGDQRTTSRGVTGQSLNGSVCERRPNAKTPSSLRIAPSSPPLRENETSQSATMPTPDTYSSHQDQIAPLPQPLQPSRGWTGISTSPTTPIDPYSAFSSSDERFQTMLGDPFSKETIEVCRSFFKRQSSSNCLKVKRMKKRSTSKLRPVTSTATASSRERLNQSGGILDDRGCLSVDECGGLCANSESCSEEARKAAEKAAQERLYRFSKEFEALKNQPTYLLIQHAKHSSTDTSTAAAPTLNLSYNNTLNNVDGRTSSGESLKYKNWVVRHGRAKSDPTVNRINSNRLNAPPELPPIVSNPSPAMSNNNEQQTSTSTSTNTQTPISATSRMYNKAGGTGAWDDPRSKSAAATALSMSPHQFRQPAASATPLSQSSNQFSFSSAFRDRSTAFYSDDNKIHKLLKWAKTKKNMKLEKAKQKQRQKSDPISEHYNTTSSFSTNNSGTSSQPGSNYASLTRQNSITSRIRHTLHITSSVFSSRPGYEADEEFQHQKEEAKKKRLKKRSKLDSSRDASFSNADDALASGDITKWNKKELILNGSAKDSGALKKLRGSSEVASYSTRQTRIDKSKSDPKFLKANHGTTKTTAAETGDSDDVFHVVREVNDQTGSGSKGDKKDGGNSTGSPPELLRPQVPLARFDSAIDEDSGLNNRQMPSTSSYTAVTLSGATTDVSGSTAIVSGLNVEHDPDDPLAAPTPRSRLPSENKYDKIAGKLAEIAATKEESLDEKFAASGIDPGAYLTMLMGGAAEEGAGAGNDGAGQDPDDYLAYDPERRARKISAQLFAHHLRCSGNTTVDRTALSRILTQIIQSSYEEFSRFVDIILWGPIRGMFEPGNQVLPPNNGGPDGAHHSASFLPPQQVGATAASNDSNNNTIGWTQNVFSAFMNLVQEMVTTVDDPSMSLATFTVLYINEHFRDTVVNAGGYESVFSDQQNSSDENESRTNRQERRRRRQGNNSNDVD